MDRRRLAVVLATWFYAGRFPVAPGTVGSLSAWAVALFAAHSFGVPAWTFSVAAAVLLPGGGVVRWDRVRGHRLG